MERSPALSADTQAVTDASSSSCEPFPPAQSGGSPKLAVLRTQNPSRRLSSGLFAAATLIIVVQQIVVIADARMPVKVVQGKPAPPPLPTLPPKPSRHRPAKDFNGPSALLTLSNRCVAASVGGYEYSVCPFDNVTQRQLPPGGYGIVPPLFWGMLGVYERYELPQAASGASAGELLFTDGCTCAGGKRRRATVTLVCSADGSDMLRQVLEPHTCEYTMELAVPEACPAAAALPPSSASVRAGADADATVAARDSANALSEHQSVKQLTGGELNDLDAAAASAQLADSRAIAGHGALSALVDTVRRALVICESARPLASASVWELSGVQTGASEVAVLCAAIARLRHDLKLTTATAAATAASAAAASPVQTSVATMVAGNEEAASGSSVLLQPARENGAATVAEFDANSAANGSSALDTAVHGVQGASSEGEVLYGTATSIGPDSGSGAWAGQSLADAASESVSGPRKPESQDSNPFEDAEDFDDDENFEGSESRSRPPQAARLAERGAAFRVDGAGGCTRSAVGQCFIDGTGDSCYSRGASGSVPIHT